MSFLFMPLLGIVVLLILLFLRRELIPRQVENEELRIENYGADGGESGADGGEKPETQEFAPGRDAPTARPQPGAADGGTLGESAPSEGEGAPSENAEPEKGEQAPGKDAPTARPQPDGEDGAPGEGAPSENPNPKAGAQDSGRDAPSARPQSGADESAPPAAPPAESAKPETLEPVAKEWPKFTLSGIAVGRERLAVLGTGEMLTAGEIAKCGVKVEKVESASVVFSWRGETKTLRKGEQSDKPADAPNAQGNK